MKRFFAVLFVLCSLCSFAQVPSPSTPHPFVNANGDLIGRDTPAPMFSPGKLDTNNSTNTPLASGATFIGTATSIIDYSGIALLVGSDVSGVITVQFSHDGLDWHDGETYNIKAGATKFFTPPAQSAFYRVYYTNNGTPQTTFFIHAVLKANGIKWSSHNVDMPITSEDDAVLVKSVLTGIRDDGIYDNATLSNSNRLKTVSQPYGFAVAENDIPGHTSIFKFGTRTSVVAGVSSTVWEGPTAQYVYLDTAQRLTFSSSDADDNGSGTGARTITLIGLDANYDELSEVATLTGLTVATTTASFSRIHRVYVTTSGTSYSNEGTITVKNYAQTTTQLVIPAGDSQTLMTIWTVPRGKRLYITNGSASTDSNKGARVSLFTRQLDGGILYPWRIRYRAYMFSGNENFPFAIPFVLPEKTDIQVRVLTPGSAGTTSFGATFDGWYEDAD